MKVVVETEMTAWTEVDKADVEVNAEAEAEAKAEAEAEAEAKGTVVETLITMIIECQEKTVVTEIDTTVGRETKTDHLLITMEIGTMGGTMVTSLEEMSPICMTRRTITAMEIIVITIVITIRTRTGITMRATIRGFRMEEIASTRANPVNRMEVVSILMVMEITQIIIHRQITIKVRSTMGRTCIQEMDTCRTKISTKDGLNKIPMEIIHTPTLETEEMV